MKLLTLLCIFAISLPLFSNDFGKGFWGDSKDKILQTEKSYLTDNGLYNILYKGKLYDFDADIHYRFNTEGMLYSGEYKLSIPTVSGLDEYKRAVLNFKKLIIDKYGNYADKKVNTYDSEKYEIVWRTDRTIITLHFKDYQDIPTRAHIRINYEAIDDE